MVVIDDDSGKIIYHSVDDMEYVKGDTAIVAFPNWMS